MKPKSLATKLPKQPKPTKAAYFIAVEFMTKMDETERFGLPAAPTPGASHSAALL